MNQTTTTSNQNINQLSNELASYFQTLEVSNANELALTLALQSLDIVKLN